MGRGDAQSRCLSKLFLAVGLLQDVLGGSRVRFFLLRLILLFSRYLSACLIFCLPVCMALLAAHQLTPGEGQTQTSMQVTHTVSFLSCYELWKFATLLKLWLKIQFWDVYMLQVGLCSYIAAFPFHSAPVALTEDSAGSSDLSSLFLLLFFILVLQKRV